MQRNNRKNMTYLFDIKLRTVKMYLEEGIVSTIISKGLNLSSNKRVLLWVKGYNELGVEGLRERRGSIKVYKKVGLESKSFHLKKEIKG